MNTILLILIFFFVAILILGVIKFVREPRQTDADRIQEWRSISKCKTVEDHIRTVLQDVLNLFLDILKLKL